MKPRHHPGFTLIELLIVVAIIAILAAIAVPNFLEAQTRAKVSRVMADMSAIRVGLESYLTDQGNYPIRHPDGIYLGFLMVENGDGMSFQGGQPGYAGSLLTTPIAYLTRIPMDVFNSRLFFSELPTPTKNLQASVEAEIQKPGINNVQMRAWFSSMRSVLGELFPPTVNWFLQSAGPDLSWWNYPGPAQFIYDPTNGTISYGQLVLSNRGWISPRK